MKDFTKALPTLAVASVALVVAASGTAGALAGKGTVDKDDLQKNVVTTKNVKNGSLKGADLKKDSLTGKQVKESSLGTVPSAASAASVESVKFFDFSLTEGQSKVLLTKGSLSLVGKCAANAADTDSVVLVATTAPGASFAGDDDGGVFDAATLEDDRDIENNSDTAGGTASVSDGYDDTYWIHAANGTAVYGTVGSVINADANSCQFFGSYTSK